MLCGIFRMYLYFCDESCLVQPHRWIASKMISIAWRFWRKTLLSRHTCFDIAIFDRVSPTPQSPRIGHTLSKIAKAKEGMLSLPNGISASFHRTFAYSVFDRKHISLIDCRAQAFKNAHRQSQPFFFPFLSEGGWPLQMSAYPRLPHSWLTITNISAANCESLAL